MSNLFSLFDQVIDQLLLISSEIWAVGQIFQLNNGLRELRISKSVLQECDVGLQFWSAVRKFAISRRTAAGSRSCTGPLFVG